MNPRHTFLAVLAGIALVAGCSASADYDDAADDSGEVPHWIRDGVDRARASTVGSASAVPRTTTTTVGSEAAASAMPSREAVLAALAGIGVSGDQAGCIYDNAATVPAVAADMSSLLSGLATAPSTGGSLTSVAGLSAASSSRLLVTIAPCVDQATLLALLGKGSPTATDTASLASLLKSSGTGSTTKPAPLPALGAAQLAQLVAGALGPQQVQQLTGLLAGLGSISSGLAGLDIANFDLSKLSAEQLPILLAAITRGLTDAQQGQLLQLAGLRLDDFDLDVDFDKLSPEELGSLLLLFAPVVSGSLKPGDQLPEGVNPGQVYVPAGSDLSNVNPLLFLNRADVVAKFNERGIDVAMATCIFDTLSRMPPATVAALFSTELQSDTATRVLLASVGCLVKPA